MGEIETALGSVVGKLSDNNYAQSTAFYRLWFEIGQTYPQVPSDQVSDAIWNNRGTTSTDPGCGKLIHPTAHLIVHFAGDAESGRILAPHSTGLQSRLCSRTLREFFNNNLMIARFHGNVFVGDFFADANLIAHWANLGYTEEAPIRDHILQSLISHPKLYDHQADALIILFKLAGATFRAYADPSVVDRCFERLKHHYDHLPVKRELVQVRAGHVVRDGHWAETKNSGGIRVTGERLGGPPSSTCIRDRKAKPDRRKPARPRCNSRSPILRTSKRGSRTSRPPASSTRICHRSRDSHTSRHPFPITQHRHSIRLHDRGHLRRRIPHRSHHRRYS